MSVKLQEEKRANKKLDNLAKRCGKERHKTKEKHGVVTQENLQLDKDIEES